MSEHLPMVFSPLLDIDDEDLLQPKRELDEVVPFEQTIHLSIRPTTPELAEVEPVRRIIHQVLLGH